MELHARLCCGVTSYAAGSRQSAVSLAFWGADAAWGVDEGKARLI